MKFKVEFVVQEFMDADHVAHAVQIAIQDSPLRECVTEIEVTPVNSKEGQ